MRGVRACVRACMLAHVCAHARPGNARVVRIGGRALTSARGLRRGVALRWRGARGRYIFLSREARISLKFA